MFLSIGTAIAGDLDKTPSWYNGDKPWTSISVEGREQFLNMRSGIDASKAKAIEKSNKAVPANAAKKGEQLIYKIQKQYGIHSYYRTPSQFGSRMVIWFPGKAWNKFTPDQKASVEAYMSSNYKNWGIGVGRIDGVDIMADRLVVQH